MALTAIEERHLAVNVDACEFSRRHEGLLAVGCYELDTAQQTRKGLLTMYQCHHGGKLDELEVVEVVGVFDAKWNDNRLAVASSSGSVDIYDWCIDGEAEDAAASDMALSVCWVDATTLLASYGSGKLVMWKLNEQGDATALWVKAKAHDYEAWSVTYSPDGNENVMYSGGDDCKFLCWDMRGPKQPVLRSSHYKVGVTSFEHLSSSRSTEFHLLVGSYNDTVACWDVRSLKSPVSSLDVGGGVWRIRSRSRGDTEQLALATMYDGFSFVECNPAADAISIFTGLQKYRDPHKTLAYGIDWYSTSASSGGDIAACGSFYDKILSTVQVL